jgi:hypothetical protein
MDIKKLKIGKPNIKLERDDIVTILVTLLLTGFIAGLIAYTYLSPLYSILIAIGVGLFFGLIVNFAKNRILSGVKYPSLKTLLELTVFTLIVGGIIAIISLGLDLVFVRIRDFLL